MSVPIADVRGRIRDRLKDFDLDAPAYSFPQLDMAIASCWNYLSAMTPALFSYFPNCVTLLAGVETFSLPVTVTGSGYGTGTTEYAGDLTLRMRNNGLFLRKVTNAQLQTHRYGMPNVVSAIPFWFALYVANNQSVQGTLFPAPAQDQPCDMWSTQAVDDLRDFVGTGGTDGMDEATIPGTRVMAQALEAMVASGLLAAELPEEAAKRKLNPKIAGDWRAEAEALLYQEETRQHALKSTGRMQRWMACSTTCSASRRCRCCSVCWPPSSCSVTRAGSPIGGTKASIRAGTFAVRGTDLPT